MKVLALDIGEKRIGVACGDTAARVALPVCVLDAGEVLSNSKRFRNLMEEHEPELLVVGLPISLDGTLNHQAERVKQLAERIGAFWDLPLAYQDERLSSVEAKRYLRDAGCTERDMRGKIDMLAASLILQAYLDANVSDSLENACS